ncbi:MAG: InlB B-repeat-containing protein [Candidatus Delongbacteria bacterium]|jgi:uncharacterized repeat protein (TIGR02543 family)|nr:InlB B-repeat-containing protein [Candidatus Delongbacteria bacterium]
MNKSNKIRSSLLLLNILFVLPQMIFCGGLKNNDANIIVNNGAHLVITGNYSSSTDGVIKLDGTMSLTGDLENNNTTINVLDSTSNGLVVLKGTSGQSITGTAAETTFPNLAINGGSIKDLGHNVIISDSLSLDNGFISLGNYNMLLNSTAVICGMPSESAMIITGGSGKFKKEFTEAGSFDFPVGADSVNYTPATLNFSEGTFNSAWAGVNVTAAKHTENGSISDYIARYWNLEQNGIADFTCSADFTYSETDIVGSENGIYSAQYKDLVWTAYSKADTLNNVISAVTENFSDFTGYQGYEISYDANEATSGDIPSSQVKLHAIDLQLQNNSGNLARTGYTFQGWNNDSEGSGTNYAVSSILAVNESVILFADWNVILTAPSNVVLIYNGSNVEITWSPVFGATGYEVYSSVDPYGTFEPDESGSLINETWTAPYDGDKRFYFVKALTQTKTVTELY